MLAKVLKLASDYDYQEAIKILNTHTKQIMDKSIYSNSTHQIIEALCKFLMLTLKQSIENEAKYIYFTVIRILCFIVNEKIHQKYTNICQCLLKYKLDELLFKLLVVF